MGVVPLKAPTGHGEVLASPPLSQVETLLTANQMLLDAGEGIEVQGKRLSVLRAEAQAAALQAARQYTRSLVGAEHPAAPANGPLIATGHQPALFHPGVWAKHFAVSVLAERHRGTGLNLIVDNDQLASTSLMIPRGPRAAPWLEPIPLVDPQPARPWEEVEIVNRDLFLTFGDRVSRAIEEDWGYRPILADAWPDAVAACDQSPYLADCLSAMRARQERRWGGANLEVPLSRLEETDPFRWFAVHLLVEAKRLREIHNDVLMDYRRRNHIRSHSHPVPALRERDGWVESPLWIWKSGTTQRRPLFVRVARNRLELASDTQLVGELRVHREADACCAVDDLAALSADGWRLRSRALTTTMFSRLFVADLFIHGIGGARYDELTDRIIERFYGAAAPAFVTLTATLHLPLPAFPVTRDQLRETAALVRDIHFNPERHLDSLEAASLHEKKRQLLDQVAASRERASAANRGNRARRREVYREVEHANDQLRQLARDNAVRVRQRLTELELQHDANRILASREHSWCLFPESELHTLLEKVRSACGVVDDS